MIVSLRGLVVKLKSMLSTLIFLRELQKLVSVGHSHRRGKIPLQTTHQPIILTRPPFLLMKLVVSRLQNYLLRNPQVMMESRMTHLSGVRQVWHQS